jgi:hypothetical protein
VMRPRERREIRHVLALVQTGDRTSAIACLRALAAEPVIAQIVDQLALPILLGTTLRCQRLGVDRMSVADCMHRRSRIWPSGAGKGSPTEDASRCEGCPIGEGIARQLPYYQPAPSTIPRAMRGDTR